MSYQLYVDGHYRADVASNGGWYQFARWGRRSSKPSVRDLCRDGYCTASDLEQELPEAMNIETMTVDD